MAGPAEIAQLQKAAQYSPLFRKYARQYDIPEGLLAGTGAVESGFDPLATNPNSTAKGLMQITRGTWNDMSRGMGPMDPFNPEHSIQLAAKYYATLRDRAGGDPARMAAMYNQGPNADPNALAAAEAGYGQKVTGFMGQYGGEQPDTDAILQRIEDATTDPSDPANQPPSITDPIRHSQEAAQTLQSFDPRMIGAFGAAFAQQLMIQEQAYRLTKQQQLMVLAQTFAPYGQGNAAGVMAGFQQQNAQKAQQAASNVQQIENRQARGYEQEQNRQAREDLLRDKRWANLENQLLKHGINYPIYDTESENAARNKIAAQNFRNTQRREKMQNDLMKLRSDEAERRKILQDALLAKRKLTDLNKSPQYVMLMKDYDKALQEIADIQDDIQNADQQDWFQQQPVWTRRKLEAEDRLDRIRTQLMALIPEGEGGQPTPTPQSQAKPQVTQEEIDAATEGIEF